MSGDYVSIHALQTRGVACFRTVQSALLLGHFCYPHEDQDLKCWSESEGSRERLSARRRARSACNVAATNRRVRVRSTQDRETETLKVGGHATQSGRVRAVAGPVNSAAGPAASESTTRPRRTSVFVRCFSGTSYNGTVYIGLTQIVYGSVLAPCTGTDRTTEYCAGRRGNEVSCDPTREKLQYSRRQRN